MSLVRIDRLLRTTTVKARQIGKDVCGDATMVDRMRRGAQLQQRTLDRLDSYLKEKGV